MAAKSAKEMVNKILIQSINQQDNVGMHVYIVSVSRKEVSTNTGMGHCD